MQKTTVLITGAGGSVGQMLLAEFSKRSNYQIHALERSEQAMSELLVQYKDNKRVTLFLADLLQPESIREAVSGCDIVIHCAALKHVNIGTRFPTQQAQENLTAFCNILNLSRAAGAKKFLFCSTDKAATPTSVMGATKYLLERICMTSTTDRFVTAAVRFGNILWSNGSLLPLIEKRVAKKQPIHLTDERMTRYLMHRSEVVDLISYALQTMRGGELFMYQAQTARIEDVMDIVIEKVSDDLGVRKPKIIPLNNRAHENLYERFLRPEEVALTRKYGKFLIFNGSQGKALTKEEAEHALSSNTNLLSKPKLKKFLYEYHRLEDSHSS